MKKGKTTVASLLIVLVTLGLDQWTKWAIEKSIALNDTVEMINHFFYLTYVRNTGAGFSMLLRKLNGLLCRTYHYCLSRYGIYVFKTNDSRYQICLSLVFSGAIGNFIDRMTLGFVRDFFSFYIFGYPFPVFNVADICITVGIALILVSMFIDDKKEQERWKQES